MKRKIKEQVDRTDKLLEKSEKVKSSKDLKKLREQLGKVKKDSKK